MPLWGWVGAGEGGRALPGQVRKGGSGGERGNAQSCSPSGMEPLGLFLLLHKSSGFHPIPKGQESVEQKDALSSSSVERDAEGMDGISECRSRLEPWLAAPCRTRSSQPVAGSRDGSAVLQGTAVGPELGLCASTRAWMDPGNKETRL